MAVSSWVIANRWKTACNIAEGGLMSQDVCRITKIPFHEVVINVFQKCLE